jgi:FAD/FMN-containing dehydrogenase
MELIGPDHELYDELRRPARPQDIDLRPQAIARCSSTEDVVEALAYARSAGLPLALRSGGHCFAARSSTSGVLIDVSALTEIAVDSHVVTIGGGARLAGVYRALHAHGLTLPAGCGPTVGIAGLTLGGGLGLLGRQYGLTCDRLVAATVVLANGNVLTCDAERHADLFWALRGAGGGQFGVVTSLVFAAVPSPAATRFAVTWPRDRAAEVIAAWQSWAPDAPDTVTACLTVTATETKLFGAAITSSLTDNPTDNPTDDPAADSASPDPTPFDPGSLAALVPGASAVDVRSGLAWPDLKASFSEGEPDCRVLYSKSEFCRQSLPRITVTELLDGGCELNFTPMGGAYNRVPAAATAFAHRSERFLLEHVGADRSAVRRSWSVAHPHGSGHVYPNFPDPDLTDWPAAYHATNYPRLQAVKAEYDPGSMFHFPQSIGGAR